MGSKTRGDDFVLKITEQKEQKVKTEHIETVENDDSNIAVPPPISALTNVDPSVLRIVFQSSKIKSFLYKIEPNIAKINGPSLDLMSTTAALLLESLVEKAVKQGHDDTRSHRFTKIRKGSRRRHDHPDNEKQCASLNEGVDHFLITSKQLKRVVSANNPSSLVFLEKKYEDFMDKDSSFIPSKSNEYVPRNTVNRNHRSTKRSATKTCNTKTTTSVQLDQKVNKGCIGKSNEHLQKEPSRKDPSSLLLGSKTNPLDMAIVNALYAEEKLVFGSIIKDDDDYD